MFCECGCGRITNKRYRVSYRFIIGHQHHNRISHKRNPLIDEWLKTKIFCKCGCGQILKLRRYHYWRKSPQFIQGHHSSIPKFKAERRNYNETHTGELSSRWVKDRSKIRHWRKNFLLSQKREIYVRDKGLCQSCGAFTLWKVNKYDPLKANFDHIIPVKNGGKSEVSNGQTLCLICHKLKHSAKAKQANSANSRTDNAELNSSVQDDKCVETIHLPRKG